MKYKNILFIALAVALILLLAFAAMRLTGNDSWSLFDFTLAGAFLFGTGLLFELITRKAGTNRAAVALALGTALILVWTNLAVGIIGSEDNPANALYFGVLAVLFLGVIIANFRPPGMARALFATALAQAVITVIVLITQKNLEVYELLAVNGFFITLWAGSALLFRRSNDTLNRQPE